MSKTDCLFIHAPRVHSHSPGSFTAFVNLISMGVFSMSNELFKNKINPRIIHLGVEKSIDSDFDIGEYVQKNEIKVIGVSMHWHYQAYDSFNVIRHIKWVNPDCFIFLGGITSSAFAEDILNEYPEVDAVIKGEGEKPVVELVSKVINKDFNLSSIPNLCWRKKKKVCLNKEVWFANEEELNSYNFDGLQFLKNYEMYLRLPIMYKREYKVNPYFGLRGTKSLVCCLGRGCSGNCTWCGGGYEATKIITGRDKITIRDPQIVAKEMVQLKKKYNMDDFYICFDPYPKKQEFLIELFDTLGKLLPNQINIIFECFGLPDKKFIDAFAKNLGNGSLIAISPELFDEEKRKIHKAFYFSDKELLECLDYINEKKQHCLLYFAELPFEKVNGTPELIKKISKYKNIQFLRQPINDFEPYSPWWLNPEKYGVTPNLKELKDYVKKSKGYRDLI